MDNNMVFGNIVVAELGRDGNRPTLFASYGPTGTYNDIRDSNNFPWYINGNYVHTNSNFGMFSPSYYEGLTIRGVGFIQFIPDVRAAFNTDIYLQYSSISYIPKTGKINQNADEAVTVSLDKLTFLVNSTIVGIRLVTDSPMQFDNYVLRIYAIPGTHCGY